MSSREPKVDATPSHERVWEDLPWYVNRSLEDAELRRLEAHLEECSTCRREAVRLERIARMLVRLEESVELPEPSAAAALTRIDAEGAAAVPEPPRPRPALAPWLRALVPSGGALGWAFAVQTLVVLALAGALLWPQGSLQAPGRGGEATFQTRSAGELAASGAPARLQVLFAPDATALEIRELLREIRAQVVQGPSASGVYVLELVAEPGDAVLTTLEDRPEIDFATRLP